MESHPAAKRKLFLQSFLAALHALRIIWGKIDADRVYGTVIYDESDPEERQDFVWHMREDDVPSDDVRRVIDWLVENRLIESDLIAAPVESLKIDFLDPSKKDQVFDELFSVEIRMIDDGEESDAYFIHN